MEDPVCEDPRSFGPDFRVIETLAWDNGYRRLPAHLARLERTCAALGIPLDAVAVVQALTGLNSDGPQRVRLTVDARGWPTVTFAPLPPAPAVWRVALAAAVLSSADPWLRLKTTRRAVYDIARANLPQGVNEVIFANERGEVCEGAITTVFADLGAGMVTPPLACGLLPGVLRAELLVNGTCREGVLTLQDLRGARLWVGNALRGLVPAEWPNP